MQLLGGPLNDSNRVIKAKAILVAVSVVAVVVDAEVEVAIIIQFYEGSMLRIGSPLGREKLTPAYWAAEAKWRCSESRRDGDMEGGLSAR